MSAVVEMPVRPTPTRPDGVLESKLRPPRGRLAVAARKQLVERLHASSRVPVVQITAPAGYGKTSLLAEWAAGDPRTWAWVTVDERDNDVGVFLMYVAAALDRIEPLAPRLSFPHALDASCGSDVVADLGRALSSMPSPVVFVFDDVDRLRSQDSLAVLAVLVEHIPEESQLVLAGRAAPRLPFPRLRAEGRLLELGADELRLSREESHSYLRAAGLTLTEAEEHVLAERTEGWPAGLRLAGLALKTGKDGDRGSPTFAGDDRFVADYLRLEVLSGLSSSEMDFLTQTAVLDKMCGSLCDAVLGQPGSKALLEELEAANLFLVPLDRQRRWYRYHRLFRDLLLAELERREPHALPELSRRAAIWWEEHGADEEAIEYACAAGDIERAARLLAASGLRLFHGGGAIRVHRWVDRLTASDSLERQPAAAAVGAWVLALDGDVLGAEQLLELAERASGEGPGSQANASIRAWIAVVRAAMCRQGVERMRLDAQAAVAELPLQSPWRPAALLLLGVSYFLTGDIESADPILLEAAEAASRAGLMSLGGIALAERSFLAAERLQRGEAVSAADEARDLTLRMPTHPTSALVHAAAARVAIQAGSVAAARTHLESAEELRAGVTRALPWLAVQTRLELARCHLSLADPAKARMLLAEADGVRGWRPSLGALGRFAEDVRIRLDACRATDASWASTLTAAELRLLPLLTTHLSFREIAERLFVSRNTVKTQAISIYRKLGASSRSAAIERAAELGLLDAAVGATGAKPTG
jgi:LuxR family transcriptional regulator, maltose regulon positive regulatory protein